MIPELVNKDTINQIINSPKIIQKPVIKASENIIENKAPKNLKFSNTFIQAGLLLILIIGLIILYNRFKFKEKNKKEYENKIKNLNNIINKYNKINGGLFK